MMTETDARVDRSGQSGRIRRCARGLALAAMVGAAAGAASAAETATQTIVFLRHGEKPKAGLGQLDCQGLNRALALPSVIKRDFGTPDAIFAPDPADTKDDAGKPYDYVRPLATIEPTAIAFGMPVDASIGVADWRALGRALTAPRFSNALVIVAWEHSNIVKLVRSLLSAHGGDPGTVPDWDAQDFDGIDVLRISAGKAMFTHRQEGLNGQKLDCPGSEGH
jgi:hypothetical protein